MTNIRYEKGRGLEYRIQVKLRAQDLFTVRSAGSHGVADIVAITPANKWPPVDIKFISCKTPEYISPNERLRLLTTAQKYGATPYLTVKETGKWVLKVLE